MTKTECYIVLGAIAAGCLFGALLAVLTLRWETLS